MTPRQIEIVRQNFAKIMPFKEQAAELFYCRLFELDPSLRLMFKSDMSEQKEKMMVMMALVTTNLDKPETLMPSARELGKRHRSYGVQSRHYDVFGAALLWTLEIALGSSWDRETAEAWQATYALLAAAMIDGTDNPQPRRSLASQAA
jgi:hemoglobin-like flavoprotein